MASLRATVDAAYLLTASRRRGTLNPCCMCGQEWDAHEYRTEFTMLERTGLSGCDGLVYRRRCGVQSGGAAFLDRGPCSRFVPGWARQLGLRFDAHGPQRRAWVKAHRGSGA